MSPNIPGRIAGRPLLCCLVLICIALSVVVSAAPARPQDRDAECKFFTGSGEPIDLYKVRLEGATRDAFTADLARDLTASCRGDAGVLIVSVGATGLGPGDTVAFQLGVEDNGRWRWVLHDTVTGPSVGWRDLRVQLPDAAPDKRRLRLHVLANEGAQSPQAYWGALRILPERADDDARPNIVLVSLDTLGAAYLGSFGGNRDASRNIDAFLERSFSFRRAYTTYPNTLVSHASLFSGLYPSTHGVYGGIRDSQVGVDTLSTVLREDGYLNVAFTENAFVSSDFGFDRDFDWYDNGPKREGGNFLGDAKQTFGNAIEWLRRFGDDGPFLLFVHTYEVHSPYIVRNADSRAIADQVYSGAEVHSDASNSADMERLHNAGFERLLPEQIRRLEALHVGEIRYLDRHFKRFMDALESLPLAERTLVVVFADHGDEFDPFGKIGHGETLADEVLHVPLAFYMPGRFGGGSYDQPVSLVDVAPTLLDFLGKSGAFPVDGRSLMPLLEGRTGELAPIPVFAELQKAAGTCQELRLDEGCFVDRFVAYSGQDRFETSSVPYYERHTRIGQDEAIEDPGTAAVMQALLSGYVTGAPWETKVPWRPQSVQAGRSRRPAIDDVTRQRLEALGYDF